MDDIFKKIPLTKRMNAIVSLIHKCDLVYDIACDHGYIGMEILKRNLANKVIFSDIKYGPLMQAKNNIEKYCKDKSKINYEIRIGDGLSVIKNNEKCDIGIITGIGYDVMVEILSKIKDYQIDYLIVSSHSKVEKFQQYLYDNNFNILNELAIEDNEKKYYIQKLKIGG